MWLSVLVPLLAPKLWELPWYVAGQRLCKPQPPSVVKQTQLMGGLGSPSLLLWRNWEADAPGINIFM